MADKVYAFFRNKYDIKTKSDNYILRHEAFEFDSIIKGEKCDSKRKITLICSNTQGGKTFTMISVAGVLLSVGYVPIFIVKDTKQKNQLITRLNKVFSELRKFLNSTPGGNTSFLYSDILYSDSKSSSDEKKKWSENVSDAFSGVRKRVIVLIHHEKHLQRIQECSDEFPEAKFALFIDEAHKLGGYKRLKGVEDGENAFYDPDVKYDKAIHSLKQKCEKLFLITATPQDILACETNLYTKGIVYLPEHKDYVGIKNWHFETLPTEDKNIKISMETHVPESFIDTIDTLSSKEPIQRPGLNGSQGSNGSHPIILLSRFELQNKKQRDIFNYIGNHKGKWVGITFNQHGIRVSFRKSLFPEGAKPLVIGKHEARPLIVGKRVEFLFPNLEISDLLYYLSKNGGYELYPRILIVSYRSAEEGITFSSTWDNGVDWHLTHCYIKTSKSISTSALEQAMGRINGNHRDGIIPTIYCSLENKKKVLKGYNLHSEQIRELCKFTRNEGDVRVTDCIPKIPIFHNRIPKNCYTIPNAKKLLLRKKNPKAKLEEEFLDSLDEAQQQLEILSLEKPYNGAGETSEGVDEKLDRESGDELRQFQLSSVKEGTILHKLYLLAIDVLLQKAGTGRWVERSVVTKGIMKYEKSFIKTEEQIRGHLRALYQEKCTLIESETENGLLLKKRNNLVYLRLN